jgi:hypothetical protein
MAVVPMEISRKEGGSERPIVATKVIVHRGRTATFWSSSWLSGGAPAMMFPALF